MAGKMLTNLLFHAEYQKRLTFLPLLPSGAFFSSYSLTIFMINISIFYASDPKSNIFSN